MAEATTPLAATIEAFDDVRGDSMDGVWAYGVSWALMMRDVDARLVAQGLGEALEVVRETGYGPADLFGSPREHADELYERWLEDGRLVLADRLRQTWPDAIRLGLGLSAACAVLVLAWALIQVEPIGSTVTLRLLPIALATGVGCSVGLVVWSRRHRPRGRAAAPDAPAEVRWSAELTEILRTRHAMSAARVRDVVAEAHLHAADSGTSLHEEFGTPEEYAARFAPDRARRSRFTVAGLTGLLVLSAVLLVDGFSWTGVALTGLLGFLVASEYRTCRAMRR